MTVRIITGDCLDVLATLDAESVHAIVTDPPYHLTQNSRGGHARTNNPESPHGRHRIGDKGFMGKVWDGGDVAFRPETWAAALRVAKPGAHLLAFGGTRTFHRLTCAIEDAGWEIRDCLMWLYGSGFPKSKNLHGDWDGWGTALKPAWEPIILARKPFKGSVEGNVAAHGTGALNIDACRIHADDAQGGAYTVKRLKPGATLNATGGNWRPEDGPEFHGEMKPGRWPANVLHDGSDEVVAHFPDAPGQMADASASASARKSQNVYGAMKRGNGRDGEPSADSANDGAVGFKMRPGMRRNDAGSAARFFYVPKASRSDRNRGIGGGDTPAVSMHATMRDRETADWKQRNGNHHPTVKPTELMQYLVRLVTPPGGTVLDIFAGSGSTGLAADIEGFDSVLIELDPENADIARRRIAGDSPLFAEVAA